MKRTEWIFILIVFLIGFAWGLISKQNVFFAIGGGLGLVTLSIPVAIVIYLIILLLIKIKLIIKKEDDIESNKPRMFAKTYLWCGIIIGSITILQAILNITAS